MRKSQQTPPASGVFPACFNSAADYAGWRRVAFRLHAKKPVPFEHCEDCTASYQAAMKAAGRCENPTHPLGIFE